MEDKRRLKERIQRGREIDSLGVIGAPIERLVDQMMRGFRAEDREPTRFVALHMSSRDFEEIPTVVREGIAMRLGIEVTNLTWAHSDGEIQHALLHLPRTVTGNRLRSLLVITNEQLGYRPQKMIEDCYARNPFMRPHVIILIQHRMNERLFNSLWLDEFRGRCVEVTYPKIQERKAEFGLMIDRILKARGQLKIIDPEAQKLLAHPPFQSPHHGFGTMIQIANELLARAKTVVTPSDMEEAIAAVLLADKPALVRPAPNPAAPVAPIRPATMPPPRPPSGQFNAVNEE